MTAALLAARHTGVEVAVGLAAVARFRGVFGDQQCRQMARDRTHAGDAGPGLGLRIVVGVGVDVVGEGAALAVEPPDVAPQLGFEPCGVREGQGGDEKARREGEDELKRSRAPIAATQHHASRIRQFAFLSALGAPPSALAWRLRASSFGTAFTISIEAKR